MRWRGANEAWVVNHVSDSISVVDLSLGAVVRTLATHDEPCDVVFAGGEIRNYRDMLRADKAKLARLNALLRERGVLKGENKCYLSVMLDERDVSQTIDAWADAIKAMAA